MGSVKATRTRREGSLSFICVLSLPHPESRAKGMSAHWTIALILRDLHRCLLRAGNSRAALPANSNRSLVQYAASVRLGSVRSFEHFAQMAALPRLAAVRDWKFKVLVLSDCFWQQRTFVKNWRMSQLRTLLPFAAVASFCRWPTKSPSV